MTEDEAKTKWCPFARSANYSESQGGVVRQVYGGVNRKPEDGRGDGDCACLASACMAWRWDVPDPATYRDGKASGYCGLAGNPHAD